MCLFCVFFLLFLFLIFYLQRIFLFLFLDVEHSSVSQEKLLINFKSNLLYMLSGRGYAQAGGGNSGFGGRR